MSRTFDCSNLNYIALRVDRTHRRFDPPGVWGTDACVASARGMPVRVFGQGTAMGEPDDDPVARSRAAEDEAQRLLDSGRLDDAATIELRAALSQARADRADGESPGDGTDRLTALVERYGAGD